MMMMTAMSLKEGGWYVRSAQRLFRWFDRGSVAVERSVVRTTKVGGQHRALPPSTDANFPNGHPPCPCPHGRTSVYPQTRDGGCHGILLYGHPTLSAKMGMGWAPIFYFLHGHTQHRAPVGGFWCSRSNLTFSVAPPESPPLCRNLRHTISDFPLQNLRRNLRRSAGLSMRSCRVRASADGKDFQRCKYYFPRE